MKPGPTIGQQLGPLGINIGQVISKVNSSTQEFKGMKVPVELDIDTKTKNFSVQVFSPPVSELLKREIGTEKGSGTPNKTRVGNLAIEQIIKIAKTKQGNMTASSLKAALKSVVGSCVSSGIFIENKEAKEVEKEIERGNYDKEINEERIIVPPAKKEKLEKFFAVVKERQDKLAAAEAVAKAAEEEAAKAAEAKPEAAAKVAEEEKKEEKPAKEKLVKKK